MLSSPTEVRLDSGLFIWRGGLDASLTADFRAEAEELLRRRPSFDEDVPFCWATMLDDPLLQEGDAVPVVLERVSHTPDTTNRAFYVNYQPPGTSQSFHPDSTSYVITIHTGDGVMDVAPYALTAQQAEQYHQSVELSAGDIVAQSKPWQYHRGRNPATLARITGAIRPILDAEITNFKKGSWKRDN